MRWQECLFGGTLHGMALDRPSETGEPDRPARRLRERLEEQEFEIYSLREMMNRLQEGIYITDNRGITLYVNDAFVHLSGLDRDELIGRRVHDLRDEGVLPNSCCARVIETRKPASTINNYYQGQKCLVSGSPVFDDRGRLIRTIAVVRDVSELGVMMEQLSLQDAPPDTAISEAPRRTAGDGRPEIPSSEDPVMQEVYDKASRLAHLNSTLLIVGETGTGKDYLAAAIHRLGSPAREEGGAPLVKINCGALPEHLIESELFGYEAGAFTGAGSKGKRGLFEEAGEGTVFLDEIGDMPYTLQVKLLGVLNDHQFYRVGGNRMVSFKARVIAATNADLETLVRERKFRADLFYRLNVIRISLPPLRRRPADIVPLVRSFLSEYNARYEKNHSISPEALRVLQEYPWPGNIRELRNFIEKTVVFSDDEPMSAEAARTGLSSTAGFDISPIPESTTLAATSGTLKERLREYERTIVQRTVEAAATLREAADDLGIDLSTLMRKKRRYGAE
ncbi:MAG: sigma 54-interacting transcriptional regulator [Spirochaetales bacterium]|nr:sigma 54-interacting transcriptional regulator [Spirochaetales bacterium]